MKKLLGIFCILTLAGCAGTASLALSSSGSAAYGSCKALSVLIPEFTTLKPKMTLVEENDVNMALHTAVSFCKTQPKNGAGVVTGITNALDSLAIQLTKKG